MRPATLEQTLKTIARNVRAARLAKGLSQEEAAHEAGMPVRQWQRVESGLAITLRTLVSVSCALQLDLSDLLRR